MRITRQGLWSTTLGRQALSPQVHRLAPTSRRFQRRRRTRLFVFRLQFSTPQGSLTGESLPVEKFHDPETKEESSPTELKNTCFMGTSVESGAAMALVVTTGVHTYLGSMARSITGERTPTSFDQGLNRFTWLMMQFMSVMVPLVFLINGFTKHDWKA